MTTASVVSLRPAPTMAVYGLAAIFLYVVPAIIFLLPTALVAAELAPNESVEPSEIENMALAEAVFLRTFS